MAKQRYNTSIDSLSYAKSEVPYVAPPTKEILSLLDNREDRYLKSKANLDLSKELAGALPHNFVSKDTYNQLVDGVNTSIAGINKDNYADSELDTAQLVKDVNSKWGGKQLAGQQADYTAKNTAITEAEDIRDEKKAWYADRLAKSLKPVTKQADGTFNAGLATLPKMVKEQKLFDDTDKIMTGWKADGLYSYNDDGSLSVNGDVLGKFGLTKTTGIKESDILQAAINYLSTDPTKAEFIADEAEFQLKDFNFSPTNILELMSPDLQKAYFPDKLEGTVTAQDIKDAVGNNPEGLYALAKNIKENDIKNSVATTIASKYGYQDVEKTYIDNIDQMEQIKAKYAKKTGGDGEDGTDLGQLVQVMPAYTVVHPSDISFSQFKTQEATAVKSYVNAKEEFDAFQAEFDAAVLAKDIDTQVNLKESVNRSRMILEKADQDIQTARQAQTNLTNSVMEAARGQGIDATKVYTKEVQNEIVKEVKTQNIQNLANAGFTVDLANFNVKVKPYNSDTSKTAIQSGTGSNRFTLAPKEVINIDLPGYEGTDLPVYTEEDVLYKRSSINTLGAIKRNGKYELILPALNGKAIDKGTTSLLTTLSNKVKYSGFKELTGKNKNANYSVKDIREVPKLNDFKQAVAELVMNENADVSELPKTLQTKAKEAAANINKKVDKGAITVNQTLDFLYVDPEAKKGTAAKRLLDLTQSLDENLISQGSQYKVYDEDGTLVDLPLYLKDLGISYTEEHIDFKNTKTSILLSSDRKFGQKIRMPLYLTADGLTKVKNRDPSKLDNSGTLNLTTVNIAGINSGFNKNLVDGVAKAYEESFGNQGPGGEQTRSALGLIKFDNDPAAESFYKLNLYTLANGKSATYPLPSGEKLVINAIKRSASPTKLGDNDFYLTKPNGEIMVVDNQDQQRKFISYEDYAKDVTGQRYNRKLFDSPGDIAGLIGSEFLAQDVMRANTAAAQAKQIKTTGASYNISPVGVTSDKHDSNKNNNYKVYGKVAKPINFKTASGKTVSLNSRVPARDLYDISTSIPNQYAGNMSPYLNVSVVKPAIKMIKDYGLYLTSAFRDDDRNANAGGKENSLHQYGKSLDASYNDGAAKLIADLQNNPQLAQDLGISLAFKEAKDGGYHLHIDFI